MVKENLKLDNKLNEPCELYLERSCVGIYRIVYFTKCKSDLCYIHAHNTQTQDSVTRMKSSMNKKKKMERNGVVGSGVIDHMIGMPVSMRFQL